MPGSTWSCLNQPGLPAVTAQHHLQHSRAVPLLLALRCPTPAFRCVETLYLKKLHKHPAKILAILLGRQLWC